MGSGVVDGHRVGAGVGAGRGVGGHVERAADVEGRGRSGQDDRQVRRQGRAGDAAGEAGDVGADHDVDRRVGLTVQVLCLRLWFIWFGSFVLLGQPYVAALFPTLDCAVRKKKVPYPSVPDEGTVVSSAGA